MAAMYQIASNPPPSLQIGPNDWSQEFRDFVTVVLYKSAADRPSTDEALRLPLFTHRWPEIENKHMCNMTVLEMIQRAQRAVSALNNAQSRKLRKILFGSQSKVLPGNLHLEQDEFPTITGEEGETSSLASGSIMIGDDKIEEASIDSGASGDRSGAASSSHLLDETGSDISSGPAGTPVAIASCTPATSPSANQGAAVSTSIGTPQSNSSGLLASSSGGSIVSDKDVVAASLAGDAFGLGGREPAQLTGYTPRKVDLHTIFLAYLHF